jgi:hypothetical protein
MRGSHRLGSPGAARQGLAAAAVVGATALLPVIFPGAAQAAVRRPIILPPPAAAKHVSAPAPSRAPAPVRIIYGHKLA